VNIFTFLTPVTYWILILLWLFILGFYIKRLGKSFIKGRLISVLIMILAIDAFRTLFESLYFGAWYTALAGFLPKAVHTFLIRPEMVFIPKIINVIAAIVVIVLLIFKWLPKEELEKETLRDLIEKRTRELSDNVFKLEREVAERKNAEKALRDNEEYLRSIYNAAENVAFVVTDLGGKDTRILDISPGAEKIFNCSRDEMIGERIALFHPPEAVENFPKMQAELKKSRTGYSGEAMLVRKTGEPFPALFTLFPRFDGRGQLTGTVGVSIDISDRKKAEEKIRDQARTLDDIFNSAPNILLLVEDNLRVEKINHKGSDFSEKKGNEAIGRLAGEVINCINSFHGKGCGQSKECGDCPVRTKVKHTLRTGEPVAEEEGRMTCLRNGRKTPVDLLISTTSIKFKENNQVLLSISDITKLKQAEREKAKLESKMFQIQRMESIGNLAGGIAHDFNNILFPIIGMSEMLLEDLPPDSLEHENATEIFNAGKRGSDLVRQILAFSRQAEHRMMPVQIQSILKEVLKLIRSTIPANIEIQQNIQHDCGKVLADATQVHQIGMNLITNAFHAVESSNGKIRVELKEILLKKDDLTGNPILPGQYILLSVSDTGTGIPKEVIARIFDPYFTTKKQGKGTGLGLAVVYGIVKDHKGDIRVYSDPGRGATFSVYLPVMEESVKNGNNKKATLLKTGTERILIVDDEKSVARLESQILSRLGYVVAEHTGSVAALNEFRTDPDKYDLIISDMTMPNMTGDQLAREILAIRPDMPIVICTGFSERINEIQAKIIGIKGLLMKPVIKHDLAQMVRKVLDEAKE